MEIIITKMVLCLLAALILGFLIGYLLARAFAKEKYEPQIASLHEELKRTHKALADNNTLFEETKQRLLDTEIKKESLSANIEELTEQNRKLSEKVVQLEKEKNDLDQALLDKEEALTAHTKEQGLLKKKLLELEKKYEETAEHLRAKIADLHSFEEIKKRLETQLSEKEQHLAKLDETRKELLQRIEAKEKNLAEMGEKLASALHNLTSKEEILKKIEGEKEILTGEFHSLQKRLSSLAHVEEANQHLRSEIEKAKKEAALWKEKIALKFREIEDTMKGSGRVDPEKVAELEELEEELQTHSQQSEAISSEERTDISTTGWWKKIREKLVPSSLDIDKIYEEAKERFEKERKKS